MNTHARSYKQLNVWRAAMDLANRVYEETRALPPSERYGLASQLRRAAVSIPANIAEGNGRMHRKEYGQALNIAMGSLCEVETLLLLCEELDLIRPSLDLQQSLDKTGRMLNRLRSSVAAPSLASPRVRPTHSQVPSPESPVPSPKSP